MTNILPIGGWFSYFTNQRIRYASFDLWSMKVILNQEQHVLSWNISFWHVMKNRCLEYFMMTNILPIKGWFSYFTNQRIRYASFNSWSMKVILCTIAIDLCNLRTHLFPLCSLRSQFFSFQILTPPDKYTCQKGQVHFWGGEMFDRYIGNIL